MLCEKSEAILLVLVGLYGSVINVINYYSTVVLLVLPMYFNQFFQVKYIVGLVMEAWMPSSLSLNTTILNDTLGCTTHMVQLNLKLTLVRVYQTRGRSKSILLKLTSGSRVYCIYMRTHENNTLVIFITYESHHEHKQALFYSPFKCKV